MSKFIYYDPLAASIQDEAIDIDPFILFKDLLRKDKQADQYNRKG
jgi:hypothetical protein